MAEPDNGGQQTPPIGPPRPPEYFFRDIAGNPVRADQSQAEALSAGGQQQISQDEAVRGTQARQNLSYVDQNWGTAGKLGMGALSGLSAGILPGYLASQGIVDPGHLRAAQASGAYTAGDMAGMALPALFTGGDSLLADGLGATPAGLISGAGSATERILGSVLGENTGTLGRLASAPIRMAGQGAVEGALISLGHNTGENLLDNKPLASEALAALGGGALFGALAGGGIGTVGALGELAVGSVGRLSKGTAAGRGAEGTVARSLGLSSSDVEELGAKGPVSKGLKEYGDVLSEGGSKVGDSTNNQIKAAAQAKTIYQTARSEVVDQLDKEAVPTPGAQRIAARIQAEVVTPVTGTLAQEETSKIAATVMNKVAPGWDSVAANDVTSAVRWPTLIKTRDQLAELAATSQVHKDILNILDSEIRSSMAPIGDELVEKYAAATTKEAIAEKLEGTLSRKSAATVVGSESPVSARDIASAGISTAFGHPYVGMTLLAAKAVSKQLPTRFEPALARYAYESMVGAKAASATNELKGKIGTALSSLFKVPSKAANSAVAEKLATKDTVTKATRKAYEDAVSRAENLMSDNHMERVRRYTEGVARAGYPQLAQELMSTNQRANLYLMHNMPPRKGTRVMSSLRKYAVEDGLDMGEHKFLRQVQAVENPEQLLDRIATGSASRDEVDAFSYTYPAAHDELISQAADMIYKAKTSGEALSVNKIVSLGVALNSPVDSILSPEYIGAVQSGLQTPPPTTPDQQNQPGPPAQGPSPLVMGLMTPMQASALKYG